MKKVYLIGNILLKNDNKPLVLQKTLQKRFPNVHFLPVDPNENFIPEDDSIIIDTIKGIKEVTYYQTIDSFMINNSVSLHDYDLGFHLKLLKKLKRISKIVIIGVPDNINLEQAKNGVSNQLNKIIST